MAKARFGNELKEARCLAGLTQREASKLIDVNLYTYRTWEQNTVSIDRLHMERIVSVFMERLK
jgi:DNA-binding XRE family transcriptional regulator